MGWLLSQPGGGQRLRGSEVAAVYGDLGLFRASTLVSRSVICGTEGHALLRETHTEHVSKVRRRRADTPPVCLCSVTSVPVTQTGGSC